MSSDNLKTDVGQWFLSNSQSFPFNLLSKEERSLITNLNQNVLISYQNFLKRRKSSTLKIFDKSCKDLSSILKSIALEDNICKFAELDCHIVALTSYLELCMLKGMKDKQQTTLNNYIKQIDCLKSIKRFYKNRTSYESYIPVVQDSVPGVSGQFSQGVPVDSVHKNLNSCIASIRNMNFANYLSPDYVELLNTRNLAYKRAKAIHIQLQLSYMDRYVKDFPIDTQTEAYLLKREGLIKSINSVLTSTSKQLSQNETLEKKSDSTKHKTPDLEL